MRTITGYLHDFVRTPHWPQIKECHLHTEMPSDFAVKYAIAEQNRRPTRGVLTLLLLDGETVAGICMAKPWFFGIYVKPEYRRKGNGRKLYEKMMEEIKHLGWMTEVQRHDDISSGFFDAMGAPRFTFKPKGDLNESSI